MMEKVILIGKKRTIKFYKNGGWVDGEFMPEIEVESITGIINPLSSRMLKLLESGKYTQQDQVMYTNQTINFSEKFSNYFCYIDDKRGNRIKYVLDSIKEWDDCDMSKIIVRRVADD